MKLITDPKMIQRRLENVAYGKGYTNMSKFYKDIGLSTATTWNWIKGYNKKMSFTTQRLLEKHIDLKDCIE